MNEFPLIGTVAAAFTAAWVLGLLTQWLRLSPIVGYLLAGVLIGPHTPGYVGDSHLAHQLAEVGVILLMFGVGLHFHVGDLLAVKSVAIPGALAQSAGATVVSMGVFVLFGMETRSGTVLGMAMAVASTVVLMRVLLEADALSSPAGHVAVGWLLVEDVLTVIVLVAIPVLGAGTRTTASGSLALIAVALLKLAALVALTMLAGARLVPRVLTQVARLRSRELFTLTVMVFSIATAAGAHAVFGASMALGAFLAGMVVAQSPVSHQAAADALPLRDAFAVLFFVAVGMLFDPRFLLEEPLLMLAGLGIILVVKPLIALAVVIALGHSVRTGLTVALGLAQIGEFSFILADVAAKNGLMPEKGRNLLVAGAILTITLNPLLFRALDRIERWLKRRPRLWALLNARSERAANRTNVDTARHLAGDGASTARRAIVVGFGPVGRTVDDLLREAGLETVIIDMNMDTVATLRREGRDAIFGDASREAILESAGVLNASHLVLTLPHATSRAAIVSSARALNPRLKVFVRAHYLRERLELEQVGATAAIFEEGEAAVALARLVLADTGARRDSVEQTIRGIRMRLILENVSTLRSRTVRSVMVPWTRVRRLPSTSSADEVRQALADQHFSRWPVIEPGTGKTLGYLLSKDLLANRSGRSWRDLLRPLGAVSPDDDLESTLLRFQREGATIYQVTERDVPLGVITVEDVLEQVVGQIADEYSPPLRGALAGAFFSEEGLLDLSSERPEQAIRELVARIPGDRIPEGVDVAELAIARERELPTHLGAGVAVPHARCPRLARPIVVFGRSSRGIAFDESSTGHLIFLMITPAEQPEIQVHLLSELASIVGTATTREALLRAATVDEVLSLMSTEASGPGKESRT